MADAIDLAVSTVIFAIRPDPDGDRGILSLPLVRRTREPFARRWSLPGGAAHADESLAETARRTLTETTRLDPAYLEQLYAFGDRDRTWSGRVVSVVYWALVRPELAAQAEEGENVRWFPADDLPELAFDHNRIVEYALWRLRNKLEYSRIAHAFLGETFTITQLRHVHEIVRQVALDPANFRRHVESSPALIATDEVVTGGRHRPPRLYRYDTSVVLADNGPLDEPE